MIQRTADLLAKKAKSVWCDKCGTRKAVTFDKGEAWCSECWLAHRRGQM